MPEHVNTLPSGMSGLYSIVLNVMLGLGIVVTIIGIILAGIQFITSKGDPKVMDKAKSALTYSVLGMVLAIGAFSVKTLILNSLGVTNAPEVFDTTPNF